MMRFLRTPISPRAEPGAECREAKVESVATKKKRKEKKKKPSDEASSA
jgi:hypothetical protein